MHCYARGWLKALGVTLSPGQEQRVGDMAIFFSRSRVQELNQVKDVSRSAEFYTRAGLRFRNEMETGPAGRQIQLEDPDGNPVELFEPAH